MSDNETAVKPEKETATPAPKKPVKKPPLSETHPDLDERYLRMSALYLEARKARISGQGIPGPLAEESRALLDWADGVVSQAVEDRDEFQKVVERDRHTNAVALRLKGDPQLVRQLMTASEELRALLD